MRTLVVLLALLGVALAMRTQSIAVKGKLLCGTAPARNVRVKLWDEDDGPDPDDELDAGYTDANGEFKLSGDTVELTTIDPVLKVYHDCDDGLKPGSRKVKFRLPSSYITEGKTPKKTLDIGTINLEIHFQNEERELIVSKKRRYLPVAAEESSEESGEVATEKEKIGRMRREGDLPEGHYEGDGHDHSKTSRRRREGELPEGHHHGDGHDHSHRRRRNHDHKLPDGHYHGDGHDHSDHKHNHKRRELEVINFE